MCFLSRDSAEKAFSTLYEKLYIDNKKFKVLWAKAQLDDSSKSNKQKADKKQDASVEESKEDQAETKPHQASKAELYPSLLNKTGKMTEAP